MVTKMNPSIIPFGLGAMQALQNVVEVNQKCEFCEQVEPRSGSSILPCQLLQHDARWDGVFTAVLMGVIIYCLTKLNLSKLAWVMVTPSMILFLFMFAGTITSESYVQFPVRMHPALM